MQKLPKEIEKDLVILYDKDHNIVGYGKPRHSPMEGWGDYDSLTEQEIEKLKEGV
jgi:hypothetical protein